MDPLRRRSRLSEPSPSPPRPDRFEVSMYSIRATDDVIYPALRCRWHPGWSNLSAGGEYRRDFVEASGVMVAELPAPPRAAFGAGECVEATDGQHLEDVEVLICDGRPDPGGVRAERRPVGPSSRSHSAAHTRPRSIALRAPPSRSSSSRAPRRVQLRVFKRSNDEVVVRQDRTRGAPRELRGPCTGSTSASAPRGAVSAARPGGGRAAARCATDGPREAPKRACAR